MSKWTDMQKRSSGELKRDEDKSKLQQWINELTSSFPESEFRKLYEQNPLLIIDYPEIIKEEKPSKKFEPIKVTWRDKPDSNFWKL